MSDGRLGRGHACIRALAQVGASQVEGRRLLQCAPHVRNVWASFEI